MTQAAFADGQLSRAELDRRVGAALAAQTLGELDTQVRDLQGAANQWTTPATLEDTPTHERPGQRARAVPPSALSGIGRPRRRRMQIWVALPLAVVLGLLVPRGGGSEAPEPPRVMGESERPRDTSEPEPPAPTVLDQDRYDSFRTALEGTGSSDVFSVEFSSIALRAHLPSAAHGSEGHVVEWDGEWHEMWSDRGEARLDVSLIGHDALLAARDEIVLPGTSESDVTITLGPARASGACFHLSMRVPRAVEADFNCDGTPVAGLGGPRPRSWVQ